MKKFTEDDIRRELPPDVMGLIHDIAYMDRRSVKGNIVERAQAILKAPSDGDITAQLKERELFVYDRCCDALCSACEEGCERVLIPYVGYGHSDGDGFKQCGANTIHVMKARAEVRDA